MTPKGYSGARSLLPHASAVNAPRTPPLDWGSAPNGEENVLQRNNSQGLTARRGRRVGPEKRLLPR